nr:histidine phosphatase family protein [Bacillus mediterraneensis]
MVHCYFVRHGETVWNTEKRSQGRLDSPLTEKGRSDAAALRERLKEVHFEKAFSSPSERTLESAAIIAEGRDLPFTTDERLMEIDLRDWQGMTDEEVRECYPSFHHHYYNQPELYDGGSGESFLDVMARLDAFLNELSHSSYTGNVLIITHGIVIKTLYLLCRNLPVDRIWDPPFIHGTSLTIMELDKGKRELVLEGCMAHAFE